MSKTIARFLSLCLTLCLAAALFAPLSVQAETVEPLNVMDYGAVGDGATDDLAAIQAAIDDAAEGLGGGVVTFPAGTYLVEEIVVLKSNITLQLDDDATILNGINQSGHPSIIFMTGPFTEDGEQVEWADTENITFIGGTIDMNGELNEAGDAGKYLTNIGSSGAFALGYSSNVTIENVTFLNSYKGHAIQICACDNVTIRNCSFKGQALPNTLTDSQKINLETVQIEPSTTKGFPYAANETGEPSRNITIEGCYFGASETCGEPVTAVGTHNQVSTCEKCHDITIRNNTFDNMMYAGVRFCGFEDVLIQGNTFIKKTAEESVNYRENGCFLVNLYCYNNTTEELDMNRRITVDGNTFEIADAATRGIRAAKDKDTYIGTVTDITITNNIITNTSGTEKEVGIHASRISDNLTITGNTVTGGAYGIKVEYCTGNVTVNSNAVSGLSNQYVRFTSGGDNQKLSFYTHGEGTLEISTADGNYTFTAVPNAGNYFVAYYKENALTTEMETVDTVVFPIDQSSSISRHPLFEVCTHDYETVVTAPTCTEQGYTTYTCSVCGDSYVGDYVDAAGHTEVVDEAVAATCTQDGLTEGKHCSVCGETLAEQEVVPALGHTPDGNTDCTKDTLCVVCGEVLEAAGEHSWDEGEVSTEPSCTETGLKTYTCEVCGAEKTEEIPANGHQYENGTCVSCGEADPDYEVPTEPSEPESVPGTSVKPVWQSWLEKLFGGFGQEPEEPSEPETSEPAPDETPEDQGNPFWDALKNWFWPW